MEIENERTRRSRRRFSAEEKARVVGLYEESGLSRAEFCPREGVSLFNVQRWLRKPNRAGEARFVEVETRAVAERGGYRLGFEGGAWLEVQEGSACEVPDYSGVRNQLTTHGLIYISPLARLLEFCVGIALQRGKRHRKELPGFTRHIWILQLLALAMAAWFLAEGRTLSSRPWMPHVVTIWFDYSGGLPIWAFLIWPFSFPAWLAAFFANRVFVALGEVSFAIYLVHFSIAQSAAKRLFSLFQIDNSSLQLALYCVLVVGASFCLYYAIERPGMAVGRYLANRVCSRRGVSTAGLRAAPVQTLSEHQSG